MEPSPAVIEMGGECDFTDPEEFLNRLSPRDPFWRVRPSNWIFRGQEGDWPLLPKAYRNGGEAFRAFGQSWKLWGQNRDDHWQRFQTAQIVLLNLFRDVLDKSGLAIPLQTPELYEGGSLRPSGPGVDPNAFPQLALAQHLGLPTPLLDWTTRPLVAAYFAVPKKKPSDDGKLVVWALRQDFIMGTSGFGAKFDGRRIVTTIEVAPRSSNANLHAQAGLFTLVRGDAVHDVTIDDYVKRAAEGDPDLAAYGGGPLMRKLTLPILHSPALLRLLADEGIDGSTMFPGYDGIVRAMTERTLWSRK
jgi:hypothetical protein